MIRCFQREGVRQVVMAGKIFKAGMHKPWRWLHYLPDWRTLRWWYSKRCRDNRDNTLLLAVIDEFASEGLTMTSALRRCRNC